MSFIEVTAGTGFVAGPVNCFVMNYSGNRCVVVDPGLNKGNVKKVCREISARGLEIKAVLITHAHADHFGGVGFLANQGIPIFTPALERPFIEYPLLEPVFLFDGAYPPESLRNKFLMGDASTIQDIMTEPVFTFDGSDFEVIALPGHTVGQVGIAYDGVLFAGDAFLDPSILAKHGVPFNIDPAQVLASLEKIEGTEFQYYLPAHGQLADRQSLREVTGCYREVIFGIQRFIKSCLDKPSSTEEIVSKTAAYRGIKLVSAQQYYLTKTSVCGYLGWLSNIGETEMLFENNRVLWKLK